MSIRRAVSVYKKQPINRPSLQYLIGYLVICDLEWLEQRLSSSTPCGMSFELLVKYTSDVEIIICTDACTEIGGGGFIRGIDTTVYFHVKWADTNKAVKYTLD